MTGTDATTKCRRCNRKLTAAASVAAGYGPGCIRKVRADVTDYTPEQTAKALRVVETGGVRKVRGGTDALFQVRGTYNTYWTSYTDCSCLGMADHGDCYHVESVRLAVAA